MPTKARPKKAQRSKAGELPLHPYKEYRLKQCMRNNARMQQLEIPALASLFAHKTAISPEKNCTKHTNCEDSKSEYDPAQDNTSEGDLFDDYTAKHSADCKKNTKKASNKTTAAMAPGGMKPRRPKRVLAEQPTTRATRSKTSLAVQDGTAGCQREGTPDPTDLALTDNPVTTPSLPHDVQPKEIVGNFDDHPQPFVQDGALAQPDDNTEMTNGSDVIAHADESNQMGNEEGTISTQHDEHNEMILEEGERWNRGVNMGHGLQKLSRARRGKLPLVIPEGRIRPEVPLVAAKFATKCNIAVRNHMPVLQHWKEYKKQPEHLTNFIGKVAVKFNMNTSAVPVKKAYSQIMKSAIRQQRYRLKKKYFDPYPLHLGDKYKDQDPTALDLFKECRYSKKKKGYTSSVQAAITHMENMISEPAEDGEQPNSVTKVVATFLEENTKKNKFLQNVGIQVVQPRSSVQNLEAQLAAEKRANAELRSIVDAQHEQMVVLSKHVEGEQARIRTEEEMKKKQAETDAKLELVLSKILGS